MKFNLTDEQQYIQKAAREFAKGEFDDDAILELIQGRKFPDQLLQKACKLDFLGICYPEAYGGQACGILDYVLLIEELCRKDSSAGIALSNVDAGAEVLCALGSENQKKALLPRLAKATAVPAVICGDLDSGSDCPAGISLKAGSAPGEFFLEGTADCVLNADRADLMIVRVRPEVPDPSGAEDPLFVLLDPKKPGVVVSPMRDRLGMDMVSCCEVRIQGANVTEDDLIRAPKGSSPSPFPLHGVNLVRTAAMFLGIAQGAFDLALQYAKQREQFKRKIGAFQGIRHKLVDMYVDLQAARSMVYAVAASAEDRDAAAKDSLAAKLVAERSALFITDEALQIFGGSGYMVELPIEHFYRDARTLQATLGRRIFQKDVLAGQIIGKIK